MISAPPEAVSETTDSLVRSPEPESSRKAISIALDIRSSVIASSGTCVPVSAPSLVGITMRLHLLFEGLDELPGCPRCFSGSCTHKTVDGVSIGQQFFLAHLEYFIVDAYTGRRNLLQVADDVEQIVEPRRPSVNCVSLNNRKIESHFFNLAIGETDTSKKV